MRLFFSNGNPKCINQNKFEPKGDPTAAADGRATCEKGEKCAVKRFKDIEDALGDENHDGIEFCLAHGIMNGTGDTTFEPDNTITRAKNATMYYRHADKTDAQETGKYKDVAEDWYKKAVNWAASNGIVNGTGDTTFSPDETITREQIATIFYRYAQTKGLDMTVEDSWDLSKSTYRDNVEIADYALTPMNWCFNHHIMFIYIDKSHGYEGLIAPKVAPTRAETAALFWQFGILLGL